jgi:aryl-alcohol dehydrogenase-like predicted oxidoreductase
MFQGAEWEKNQDFLDRLRELSSRLGRPVAQIAVNWVISQPGITSALCGAKRPQQISDCAAAMQWRLLDADRHIINEALLYRGEPVVRLAV